jgi:hypothetical protein
MKGVGMSEGWKGRLGAEAYELRKRIEKLERFFVAPEFEELYPDARNDLREQLTHMKAYHTVLCRRLNRLTTNA